MSLSIIVAFELFFGDEYWKQCTLLCLNIHLQWKAKKRRWFKNSLMSWAFKVAKQMWDWLRGHLYTALKKSKEVKSRIFVFGSFLHNYIILILQILCKREPNTKKLFTACFFTPLNCCVLVANEFFWPLWLLSVSLSSFHLESSLFRLTIFRTLFVTLLIKVRMHVEPSLNITVDIVQRFFLNLEFEGRMTDRGEVNI